MTSFVVAVAPEFNKIDLKRREKICYKMV